eukprot:CAMPEP_0171191100 /NCGR_PEP_ID=MMETSP0790-20130122/19192_1 /TAXON_ID=2925 /ORGANISM="Alexandrium catenella, Strain OF101" /LENGTH=45 /DNA_ID= /DNA_START= /DNA_END= /DNA_ORIENTATION=
MGMHACMGRSEAPNNSGSIRALFAACSPSVSMGATGSIAWALKAA